MDFMGRLIKYAKQPVNIRGRVSATQYYLGLNSGLGHGAGPKNKE